MHEMLIVDLDHTLLKSDMLYESFWFALRQDWRHCYRALFALRKGKAALKAYLAAATAIDVTTLPYDKHVIDYINDWRKKGGQVALVTASDQNIADAIAAHLQLFDAVYGSNGQENLKGEAKARFLVHKYGEKQFSYMGDSKSDLPVWRKAKRAITVNLSKALKTRVAAVVDEAEHLDTQTSSTHAYWQALRPHQWMKNVLVFLPMLAGHQFSTNSFYLSVMAFIGFSLVASSVYVLNDLLDLTADRAHPRKRFRPFAAGNVPIAHGIWLSVSLLVAGLLIATLLGSTFIGIIVAYYALTTAYSLSLKKQIVADICVLAGLYTARIVAGSAATDIPLSVWLLAFAIFFFLSLAAVKRQAELVDNINQGKCNVSGRGYCVDDLPLITMISISAGYIAVLVLALYVNSPAVTQLYTHPELLWGVCATLLYWITRTIMITHRGEMHDDPVVYAAKDSQSQMCFFVIVTFAVLSAAL